MVPTRTLNKARMVKGNIITGTVRSMLRLGVVWLGPQDFESEDVCVEGKRPQGGLEA